MAPLGERGEALTCFRPASFAFRSVSLPLTATARARTEDSCAREVLVSLPSMPMVLTGQTKLEYGGPDFQLDGSDCGVAEGWSEDRGGNEGGRLVRIPGCGTPRKHCWGLACYSS